MPQRLKLHVWTPLPPRRSGVADHNLLLLPALAEFADVHVVLDEPIDSVRTPEGISVIASTDVAAHPPDLAIYHMGNHHGLHRGIHDALIANPGLLVLHDPSLVDFYGAYHEGTPGGFDAEVRFNHGVLAGGPPRIWAGSDWHSDRLALQLARRVVEPSLATVVHSAWARDVLARQFPHKALHHVHLAAPVAEEGARGPDMRRRAGWSTEHVVFGLLGGLWAHKRPELAVRVFAALHPLRPNARLLVAGRPEDAGALTRTLAAISDAGLEEVVHLVTNVDDDEFGACIAACDTVVDLRWPTAGETSATVMRAFGAGRPVIVSDLPQYRALDSGFCWRVPTEPAGAAAAALEVMLAVARDPGQARRAGRQARTFVETSASLEQVAGRYAEVARQVVEEVPTASPRAAAAQVPAVDRASFAVWSSEDPGARGPVGARETWVPSRFARRLAIAAGVPNVAVVPWPVDAPPTPGDARSALGLPAAASLFLAIADARWPEDLQNPLGAVDAFRRAFDDDHTGHHRLVLASDGPVSHDVRRALEEVDGLLLEGRTHRRAALSAVDVVVSLHRATTFGLVLAEAMYLGKPVIATAYSGNVDFMNVANSCLVGYRLPAGGIGAEPDLDQAAAWMRRLHEHPEERVRIGANAASTIRAGYSPDTVGRVMAERLREAGQVRPAPV